MKNQINEFRGYYRFLSNFYPAIIEYEEIIYPTAEHAYQAAKTFDQEERLYISKLSSPGSAKRYGKKIKLRDDWNKVKLYVMYDICYKKFTDFDNNPDLIIKLLFTHPKELIEGNKWNDTFWGICNGVGQNFLGKILMKIREELIKNIEVPPLREKYVPLDLDKYINQLEKDIIGK